MNSITKVGSIACQSLCVICFVVQAGMVTHTYLQYSVTTDIELRAETSLKDMINRSTVDKQLKGNLPNRETEQLLTLRNIFDLTPNVSQVVESCAIRNWRTNNLDVLDSSQCSRMTKVLSFLTNDLICYKIDVLDINFLFLEKVANSFRSQGLLYKVDFGLKLLNSSKFVKLILSSQHSLPRASIKYSPLVTRIMSSKRSPRNFFAVTYTRMTIKMLPSPYKTNCVSEFHPRLASRECVMACLTNFTLKARGKLPNSEVIMFDEVSDYEEKVRILDQRDLDDERFAEELALEMNKCERSCSRERCVNSNMFTEVLDSEEQDDKITVEVKIPVYTSIELTFKPAQLLNEYLIYVLSCLGTWLGLSMMQLNPFEFWARKAASKPITIQTVRVARVEPQLLRE